MSESEFTVEEEVTKSEVKIHVLFNLLLHGGRMNYRELLKALGRPDRTLYVNLLELQRDGFVKKEERGLYVISEAGLRLLKMREAELEAKIETELGAEELERVEGPGKYVEALEEHFREKFRRFLVGLTDLKSDLSLSTILVTFGVYPLVMFVKSAVKSSEDEVIYHAFLASTYVNSVDLRALMKNPSPHTVEYFWQTADPKLIAAKNGERRQEILGFEFNFSKGYRHALNNVEKAEEVLSRYGRKSEERIFARLKILSHPVGERRKIIKEFTTARSLETI